LSRIALWGCCTVCKASANIRETNTCGKRKQEKKRQWKRKGKEKRSADLSKTKYLLQIVLKEDSCYYYLSYLMRWRFDDQLPLKLLA
jgi:hypothetical protein